MANTKTTSKPVERTINKETDAVRMTVIFAPCLFLLIGSSLVANFYERAAFAAIMQTVIATVITRSIWPLFLTAILLLGLWSEVLFGAQVTDYGRMSMALTNFAMAGLVPLSIAAGAILSLLGRVPSFRDLELGSSPSE
jgi:hypothetical protein